MAQKKRNRNTPRTTKYHNPAQNTYPVQGSVAYQIQPKEEQEQIDHMISMVRSMILQHR